MYLETEPIPYGPNRSFASIRFKGPVLVCPYHRHPEIELVYVEAGSGRVVLGDFVGTFCTGDLFLLGSNLPHIFQSAMPRSKKEFSATHVIQFRRDFAGAGLFDLPEFRAVRHLFKLADRALKIPRKTSEKIRALMLRLHEADATRRVGCLLDLLATLSESKGLKPLNKSSGDFLSLPADGRMPAIMAYIQENLTSKITVPGAAKRAGLTPNALCRYFKRQTRRNFTDVVNEFRVQEACRLLEETCDNTTSIAFASGFSNLSHFYNEFRRRLAKTPGEYRLDPTAREKSRPESAPAGKRRRIALPQKSAPQIQITKAKKNQQRGSRLRHQ